MTVANETDGSSRRNGPVAAADALGEMVVELVEGYIRDLEGNKGLPIYEMAVMAAERPLLKWAMQRSSNNQKAAAKLLGINRNTLHKKLVMHGFVREFI